MRLKISTPDQIDSQARLAQKCTVDSVVAMIEERFVRSYHIDTETAVIKIMGTILTVTVSVQVKRLYEDAGWEIQIEEEDGPVTADQKHPTLAVRLRTTVITLKRKGA